MAIFRLFFWREPLWFRPERHPAASAGGGGGAETFAYFGPDYFERGYFEAGYFS